MKNENITIIESFYFFFVVVEKKNFYVITNKQGQKIRINKSWKPIAEKLTLSSIIKNIEHIKGQRIKETATKKQKQAFEKLLEIVDSLERFLGITAYSYKSLMREAISNLNF